MSTSDFRQIALRGEEGRAERLFRASVSAYCALTRPTRRNAAQLDDLTLPLYEQVSVEARRYVAAALSECRRAPLRLMRRLAAEPVEISAPLLMRSPVLTDFDLVSLIAYHGIAHARAIASRSRLNPAITRLIRMLEAATSASAQVEQSEEPERTPSLEEEIVLSPSLEPSRPGRAEETRGRLRAMMAVGGDAQPALAGQTLQVDPAARDKLRDTALTGVSALFQTALADIAGLDFSQAAPLTQRTRRRSLMLVLRGLGLNAEQAFLLVSAIDPQAHPNAESIRLFVEHFELIRVDAGRDEIRRLKADSIAAVLRRSQGEIGRLAGERSRLSAS